MARVIILVASAVALAAGFGAGLKRATDEEPAPSTAERSGVTVVESPNAASSLKPETRKPVGEFRTRKRKLAIETVETTDGLECLRSVDVETGAAGSVCSKRDLFAVRNVAFTIDFGGRPGAYESLELVGIAAPGISAIEVTKTDGSSERVELGKSRAFVVEASRADLDRAVHPASLVLYRANGKRVEEVGIPPLQ